MSNLSLEKIASLQRVLSAQDERVEFWARNERESEHLNNRTYAIERQMYWQQARAATQEELNQIAKP